MLQAALDDCIQLKDPVDGALQFPGGQTGERACRFAHPAAQVECVRLTRVPEAYLPRQMGTDVRPDHRLAAPDQALQRGPEGCVLWRQQPTAVVCHYLPYSLVQGHLLTDARGSLYTGSHPANRSRVAEPFQLGEPASPEPGLVLD